MFRFPFRKQAAAAGAAAAGAGAGGAAGAGMAAGAIMNGISSLGGLALGISQLVMQKNANKQAREDQYYFYNDQKNWQSPANQMRLRQLAGLNPYGDFTTGSVGQPTPVNMAAGTAEAAGLMANSMSQGVAQHFNYLAQKIALKQLNLEEKRVDNDTKIAEQNAKLLANKNLYQEIMNFIADNTKGNSVQMSNLEVEQMLQNLIYQGKVNQWYDSSKKAELQQVLENIFSSRYMRTEYNPKMLAATTNLSYKQAQKLQKEFELLGYDEQQAKFNADLYEQLNNIGDNLPKGTPKAVAALIQGLAKIAMVYMQSHPKITRQ